MNKTPCSTCTSLECRKNNKDCYGIHEKSAAVYQDDDINKIALSASSLIDNDRAGTLTRVEEIIEYCKKMEYQKVGIAFCFGIKIIADKFKELLEQNDITALPVVCSSGAVMERTIDPQKTKDTISCNPAAQALILNKIKPDLVVSIGLCLGHDIIFNTMITVPHTVLIVKDRVLNNNPSLYFSS